MAKVKAIVSFAGAELSMYPGEEREVDDKVAASLSKAGLVELIASADTKKEALKDEDKGKEEPVKKETKKSTKKTTKE